jgi:hypothetical protein
MVLLEKGVIFSLLTEGVSVVGIALALFRIIFFAIFYFDRNGTTYLEYMLLQNVDCQYPLVGVNNANVAAGC